MLWAHTFQEASLALRRGDADRADELATKALEIGSASEEPDAFMYYGGQLICARDQQGRLGELVDLIADVAQQNPGMPVFTALLAWAQSETGEQTTARALLDAAADADFDLPQDSTWVDSIICYASIAVQLRLRERCEELFALLAPFHDQVPCQGVTSREPVAMYLGGLAVLLGRYDASENYFQEADDLNTRGGMLYAEAQTNLWWGRMLRARARSTDLVRADQLLEKASTSARTHGYALIESRAAAVQRR
jgi:tetratricopeptide (TPR) repeat protein